jgi:[ribosomal protein S18]-alanine N-acetyltransferase
VSAPIPRDPADLAIGPADIKRDLDDILDIDSASFTNSWTREMFEWEARNSDVARVFVARQPGASGRVVAYCAVWVIFDELHINNLAVLPEWRRRGVAKRLLHHVLERTADDGAERATLEVRQSNEPARRLYERFGFAVTGIRPRYYSNPVEDAIVLWRGEKGASLDIGRETLG